MSSVILSTWVITLSTLLIYLPELENVSFYNSCLRVYQSETCNNDNCAGSRNIHSLASRIKLETILRAFISQSHSNLFDSKMSSNLRRTLKSLYISTIYTSNIQPVAMEEEPHSQSLKGSKCQ